jgi:hypothetical protein
LLGPPVPAKGVRAMSVANRLNSLVVCFILGSTSSCTFHSTGLRPPSIDARAAGEAAITQFDTNGDHLLAGPELDRIPAIRSALGKFDSNGDKQVSAEEIASRIESWQIVPVAAIPLNCSVRVSRQPLAGATIELIPEPFLGDQLRPARGTTDNSGFAYLSMTSDDGNMPALSGVQCGLYKVRIAKLNGAKPAIPAKYNTETILGLEVAPDAPCVRDGLRFDL